MKNVITIIGLVLFSSTILAAPNPMRIKINNAESLYQAAVTLEQLENNTPTRHIYNGKVVDREIAKAAFFRGETTCRVLLDGQSAPMQSEIIIELVMELPTRNRKILSFIDGDQKNMFSLTCQARGEITRDSILKTLGSLIEKL